MSEEEKEGGGGGGGGESCASFLRVVYGTFIRPVKLEILTYSGVNFITSKCREDADGFLRGVVPKCLALMGM